MPPVGMPADEQTPGVEPALPGTLERGAAGQGSGQINCQHVFPQARRCHCPPRAHTLPVSHSALSVTGPKVLQKTRTRKSPQDSEVKGVTALCVRGQRGLEGALQGKDGRHTKAGTTPCITASSPALETQPADPAPMSRPLHPRNRRVDPLSVPSTFADTAHLALLPR